MFSNLLKEFKQFAVRGNVLDLAVGVIIGGAFGKIVSSLVADIIMPPLGLVIGGVDFKKLQWVLSSASDSKPATVLSYGAFIQNVFDFLVVAAVIFTVIKLINAFHRQNQQTAPPPAAPNKQEVLLTEIRDILKNKS